MLNYKYDRQKDLHTWRGYFGFGARRRLERFGLSPIRANLLFRAHTTTEISINGFFLLDLSVILTEVVDAGSEPGVNLRLLMRVRDQILDDILKDDGSKLTGYDERRIPEVMRYDILSEQRPVFDNYNVVRNRFGCRGMLVDAGVGTGKTFMSLALATALNSSVTVIIVPISTVTRVWGTSLAGDIEEPSMLYKTPQSYYNVGQSSDYNGEAFILTHYENLGKLRKLVNSHRIRVDTVIIDEVHNFNDPKSKRTALLIDTVNDMDPSHVIPMSGTTVKAAARELLTMFRLLDKRVTKVIAKRATKLYNGRSRMMAVILPLKYKVYTTIIVKNEDSLPAIHTNIRKVETPNSKMFTLEAIKKDMVAYLELRTKYYTEHKEEYDFHYKQLATAALREQMEHGAVTAKEIATYDDNISVIIEHYNKNKLFDIPDVMRDANMFEKQYIESWLRGEDLATFRNAKSVYKYVKLKIQGETLANVVMRARIECYTDIAANADIDSIIKFATKKTLVFSNYVDVCRTIEDRIAKDKGNPIGVYGESTKLLTTNVNRFIHDDNINPLISTYKSLSTGVPLIQANVVMMFGLPHRDYIYQQTIGRAWRLGQDSEVSVYVMELDTGDVPNITDRDFDIITFFKDEVTKITGLSGVGLDRELTPTNDGLCPEEESMNNNGILGAISDDLVVTNDMIRPQLDDWVIPELVASYQTIIDIVQATDMSSKKFAKTRDGKLAIRRLDELLTKRFKIHFTHTVSDGVGYAVHTQAPSADSVLDKDLKAKRGYVDSILGSITVGDKDPSEILDVDKDPLIFLKEHKDSLDKLNSKIQLDGILIDSKTATIEGLPDGFKINIVSDLSDLILNAGLTARMLTAILIHEIGHGYTHIEYTGRLSDNTSVLIDTLIESIRKQDSTEDRIRLVMESAGDTDYVVNTKDKDTMVIKALDHYLRSTSTRTYNTHNVTDSEQLADQFAARFGMGVELAEGLVRMNQYGLEVVRTNTLATLNATMWYSIFLSFLYGASVVSVLGSMVIVGALVYTLTLFIAGFITNGGLSGGNVYDMDKRRLKRIMNDLTRQMRNGYITDENMELHLTNLARISVIVNGASDGSGVAYNVNKFFQDVTSKGRTLSETKMTDELLEDLQENDLHIQQQKFRLLGDKNV